jgi:hypothetical protein
MRRKRYKRSNRVPDYTKTKHDKLIFGSIFLETLSLKHTFCDMNHEAQLFRSRGLLIANAATLDP